jgi:hypothetical protein
MQIPLKPTSCQDQPGSTMPLFLFAGAEARLPSGGLLAGRRGYCLDLLFFRLPGFPITLLFAFSHAHSLLFLNDAVLVELPLNNQRSRDQRRQQDRQQHRGYEPLMKMELGAIGHIAA